jgi:signal transduction histidine kinase
MKAPRLLPLFSVALGVAAMVAVCRVLGFGAGVVLGATPASGLSLFAALVLRGPGALAAAAGFALGDLPFLAPAAVATDATAHGLASLAAATTMRAFARRYRPETRTPEWRIFLAGVATFAPTASAVVCFGALAGLLPRGGEAMLVAVFEPLGILSFGSILANLREFREVVANPRPALGIAGLALALLAALWLLLVLPLAQISASGVTMLLAIPFCLWVAMQQRSLDGAALSFVAAHVAVLMILYDTGSITSPDYVTTVVYLNLLVATCQLVHSVNRDRVAALAENAAHRSELERRVVERTARLKEMSERALAADAAKTRFLATVSHEVRTPLNGVIGMACVVLDRPLDPEMRRNVEVIRTSGLHLLDVINRILDYARLEHDPRPYDDSDFDLCAVVDEVVEEARFSHHAEGIEFRATIAPGFGPWRLGYRQGVRQILTNLVGNAAKFTEQGSVAVRVLPGQVEGVRLEVEDTGIGIPAEVQTRIFKPFEQVDGSITRRFGGTGLGLAISAELAARMGGRIGVASEKGMGALFWVELPLPRAGAAQAAVGA